ncbi:MAG: hypothetical protein K2X27_28140 [Candidatus Obscuribacterales bacterium]|nr:hypothetical protein [Candidatus Obscuribacterales bacterium]
MQTNRISKLSKISKSYFCLETASSKSSIQCSELKASCRIPEAKTHPVITFLDKMTQQVAIAAAKHDDYVKSSTNTDDTTISARKPPQMRMRNGRWIREEIARISV